MKTRDQIKNKARELFNQKGFKNVTLREVSAALEKSYGNITYHFKTKDQLILELFEDMLIETVDIMSSFVSSNLLHAILDAPKMTFKISMKYLFFYVDYVEIKRSYNAIYLKLEESNAFRKKSFMKILKQLQRDKILRAELTTDSLDYLMDISGAVRTFFFINLQPKNFADKKLESQYLAYVNKLVMPYLTPKGLKQYNAYLN